MRIDIVTLLPELIRSPFEASILKRAQTKGLVEVHLHDLREFGRGKHKQVDDYAFGGGAGMVIKAEPLFECIEGLLAERDYDAVVYTSPDGQTLDQPMANRMSSFTNLLLVCGHYKGIDQRVRDRLITHEISIGDYVLSGGELAAAVIADALIRLIPGVLNDETSALTDSFQDNLLAPPVYTRPAEFRGMKVPEVLTSGNFTLIDQWRSEQALSRTRERRPDLLGE
ncbi:MAG: tRNA (guanosine(37)-N1)-methyltransferase TrmD [Flavobacteriaceae bacterium]|nr:tRNA (guanosine(37)-N1)-methyltransferase TrmD [Flavobacteriaceae bacterium]PHX83967.1 MAG: tRNA (guanosine(37)-N1)-methyltransferase TrmD [Flavobacteriales bacterium]